ncbi:MAG: hypothetical protein PVF37_21075 [Desulfobacterales bacterium]
MLTYNLGIEKVLVTGAVFPSAPAADELDMAVKMTQQSAQEALTREILPILHKNERWTGM